ncbi:MAG: hypothetical protein J6S67_17460 [Methanobrevibacter sp.]|nr:hypothetical protein [Methanobrevibacter sp.]
MIPKLKTVDSEGIPSTPIIEAEKIPCVAVISSSSPIPTDVLPPNILANTTFTVGKVNSSGGIDTDSNYITSDFIGIESGYDYLIVLESENSGTQNAYIGCYSGLPSITGFITRMYIAGSSEVNYFTKLVAPVADYIRLSVRADNGDVKISVIKVDISTITNYINIDL